MTASQSLEYGTFALANCWKHRRVWHQTNLLWFSEIPQGWGLKRTKYVLHERKDKGHPNEPLLAATQSKGVVRKDQYENRTVVATKDLELLKLVLPGDFVISLRSFEGGIEYARERGIISPAYTVLHTNDSCADGYLLWLFKSDPYIQNLRLHVTGIREGQNIDYLRLRDSLLPLPPSSEQHAIADFLDRETAKIDTLVEKKRELIEKLKEKRTALISHAVTRGLDPNAKLKPSGIEWLGGVPEHWEVKKLGWLFRYAKGPSAALLTKEYVGDNAGNYPVFSGQTEDEGLMGKIDWYEFDFANPVIFVTTVGARAMSTRIISGKFSLSQNCALIVPRRTQVNVGYYEAVLRGLFDYERRSISLIMQPSLRFDDLDKFRVPVPPQSEQLAIADFLDRETAKIDTLVAKVTTAIEKLQEYRTALITAAVTGKIDVRGAME